MNLKQDNDVFKLNRIHQMFSAIYKMEMETEEGTKLINTIKLSIKDVIMPNMVEVKNKIISSKH